MKLVIFAKMKKIFKPIRKSHNSVFNKLIKSNEFIMNGPLQPFLKDYIWNKPL